MQEWPPEVGRSLRHTFTPQTAATPGRAPHSQADEVTASLGGLPPSLCPGSVVTDMLCYVTACSSIFCTRPSVPWGQGPGPLHLSPQRLGQCLAYRWHNGLFD